MTALAGDPGSFRDPANRVYILNSATVGEPARVLRGVSQETAHHLASLFDTDFYKDLLRRGYVVPTSVVDTDDPMFKAILEDGWHSVLEHETIPFVSYPYEWSFSMLKDAALLQLRVIRDALENGWTLKDATPYNVQFRGSQPVFIDIPSFVPREDGEAWVGYRQFCSMFLFPLMIRSHLGIDHLPLLRSYLDGIPPTEAEKNFTA
ncbi:MAG: methyltransferase, partial [Pseudomonadota bacterium]